MARRGERVKKLRNPTGGVKGGSELKSVGSIARTNYERERGKVWTGLGDFGGGKQVAKKEKRGRGRQIGQNQHLTPKGAKRNFRGFWGVANGGKELH